MSVSGIPTEHERSVHTKKEQAQFRTMNWGQSAPQRKRDLRLHQHAVLTGDYYMFNSLDDHEEPILYEEYDFLERHDIITHQQRVNTKIHKKSSFILIKSLH